MNQPRSSSRREFLKFAGLGSLVFGAGSARALGADGREASANSAKRQAKNVIFMVSDGMCFSVLTAAQTYLTRTEKRPSNWMKMYGERPVVRSLSETDSASGIVTDSAAAASCWGIGERIDNGVINITQDGRKPVTLIQKMNAAKKRCGLVTTTTVTHATPAGFVATVASRSDQKSIAAQYLERGVDVVLGGGTQYFSDDLVAAYRKAGYGVALNRGQLLADGGKAPLLGLFSKSHVPFEIDRLNSAELKASTPTLSEMTKVALQRLGSASEGFFLVVEGGRVDHAAHGNDGAAAIREQVAFDEAIATVLAFVDKNPDTLLVITTDHGTGGFNVNGLGSEDFDTSAPSYAESSPAFDRMTGFTSSLELLKAGTKGLSPKDFAAAAEKATGLKFKADDRAKITSTKALSEVLMKYTSIGWTSNNHTGEMVEFCSFGPGSQLFTPHLRNDQVHAKILQATGVA
jgi:alkaline phosphatase